MPPKKASTSKKQELKKKEKTIDDKTFGLKNKKGSKQQKFIETVNKQVHSGGKVNTWAQDQERKKAAEKKKAKEQELAELEKLFGKVEKKKKVEKVDPTSKSKKADIHADTRDNNEDNMEGWTEEELRAAIERKHGKSNKNVATTTDKVCNNFINAVENNKYGWFWECANGDKCKYRHALPEGYVLKRDLKKLNAARAENQISLEDLIERERAALGPGTKITWETFTIWKKRKVAEKKRDVEVETKKKKGKAKSGNSSGLTGRELFMYNADMGGDDDEAEDILFEKEETDPNELVTDWDQAALADKFQHQSLLRSKGAIPTAAENRYYTPSLDNPEQVAQAVADAAVSAEKQSSTPATPVETLEVDEDLFGGDDLDDLDTELGDMALAES